MYEIEEIIKRIKQHKGVVGTIFINEEGFPTKSSLDNTLTMQYAALLSALADQAGGVVRDLDPSNEILFLRIRSLKNEILIAKDQKFKLVVIQKPTD